jgi:hypothetical protein
MRVSSTTVKDSGIGILGAIKMKAGGLRESEIACSYRDEDYMQETRFRITKCEEVEAEAI